MATETKNTKPVYNTEIPSDWEVVEFGEIVNYKKGFAFKNEDYSQQGVRILRVSDTNASGIKKEGVVFLESSRAEDFKEWMIKENDIIIQTVGSRPPLYDSMVGKAILVQKEFSGSLLNQNAVRIRMKIGNNFFLYSHFTTKRYFNFIETLVRGNANQVSITLDELFKFKIPLPPFPEQKAIAQVLSTADAAIQTTEKLITQKELRKKWLMQQLLTGKKRLKGFENTKWKIQPLENFIKSVVREVPKPDVPYLGIGLRSHGKGTFLKPDEQPEKNSMDKFYVVRPNDLIVNITFAWEQAIAIVRAEDDGALASHRFPTYTFIEDKGHSDFFRFYILLPRMKFMLQMISPGGAGRNRVMSKSDFIKLEFLLPDYKEQTAIANVLQVADKEIRLLKAKAEKLREQKKWLMQVLLTGKVRLKI